MLTPLVPRPAVLRRTLDEVDFLRLLQGLKLELAESHGIQDLALTHYLCFLWYPLRNQTYWWCAAAPDGYQPRASSVLYCGIVPSIILLW